MTEDQFRRALSAHVAAHLRRLDVSYAFLFNNAGVLIETAQKNGVSKDALAQIIADENDRVEAALDDIMAKYQRPQPVLVR